MNQPPSRHPLFVAIACIALAGAWGTGAYEAETGESLTLLAAADPPTPERLGLDCPGPRGPTRALCLFEASRPSSLVGPSEAGQAPRASGAAVAPGVRVATRQLPTGPASP